MEKYYPIICSSILFSGIEPDQLDYILSFLDARTGQYGKDQYIMRSGDTVEYLGLILSGHALIIKEDFWGNRNILMHLTPGQCIGETFACSPGTPLNLNIVTETPCFILFLSIQRILTACRENQSFQPLMVRNMLRDLASKNLEFSELMTHLGQRTTRDKVLSYLSIQSEKAKSSTFEIPYSRQQMADYLFIDRSGLSAELSKMKKEGLLDYNKNVFTLKMPIEQ